jgi:hypothetical protein
MKPIYFKCLHIKSAIVTNFQTSIRDKRACSIGGGGGDVMCRSSQYLCSYTRAAASASEAFLQQEKGWQFTSRC